MNCQVVFYKKKGFLYPLVFLSGYVTNSLEDQR